MRKTPKELELIQDLQDTDEEIAADITITEVERAVK